MPTSADTLVRLAKRAVAPPIDVPEVVGVDDFAFRRGKTYGTILVDLGTNRPIDLLTERTGDALAEWLREHPGVKLICRDRSSEYARGASEGAPQAQQSVDRWHVLKNLGEVVLRGVGRTHAALKQRQATSGVQRHPRYKKLREPQRACRLSSGSSASSGSFPRGGNALPTGQKHGRHRGAVAPESDDRAHICVRRCLSRMGYSPGARKGQLGSYLPYLEQRVQEGCDNASLLWREIRDQGCTKGYKVVNTRARANTSKSQADAPLNRNKLDDKHSWLP